MCELIHTFTMIIRFRQIMIHADEADRSWKDRTEAIAKMRSALGS